MQARLGEMERTVAAAQTALRAEVIAASEGKKLAEQAGAELKTQLEELRTENEAAVAKVKAQAAANEAAARAASGHVAAAPPSS
jgi:hypothetical protein